ncbi:DUF397 domain-containing protein [Streptomyces sp. NPDC057101]
MTAWRWRTPPRKGSAVRDSKTPAGPRLFFAADAWGSFIGAVRGEEL